jgi:hypothetical protein
VHRFQRKRNTLWWERQRGVTWNRIHVHKFRLSYHFRIHGALHVFPDEVDAGWLNGPYSADGFYEERVLGVRMKFLEFSFQDREPSISSCADSMSKFVELRILPWFERWDDNRALIEKSDSPLSAAQKEMLRAK